METKFFSNVHKGEIAEMRILLRNSSSDKRATGMNKVLLALFKGINVDCLFPDVLNCAQTNSIKLKKQVFLYLTATAKRQPELAMLAINTLTRDLSSPLPLVRALALRAAVGMKVDKLAQHLVGPIQQCLSDEDAYVRKVAALSVAHLYHSQPHWVEDVGFVARLKQMTSDANAAVAVNAVAALNDIGKLDLTNYAEVNTLLVALNDSHEWGQVTILEALSQYQPSEAWEVSSICNKVSPFLAHSNAAVVLAAIRILLQLVDQLPHENAKIFVRFKLGPPLKTLLSNEPAIQYVTLRNIQIILHKYPQLLREDVRLFFIKYNDPIYLKIEKLEVLIKLIGTHNVVEVLSEFQEYARDADMELVRNAVLAIGRCAIKLECIADRCVKMLQELIETKINYTVEAAIIAFRDVFRRYPGKYDQILSSFSGDLEEINGWEARAAFIWMLGEYAERIEDAESLLESFVEKFNEEVSAVQLAILTAVIKLFVVQPSSSVTVYLCLQRAVAAPNPDLRDRAYIYWRLLSTDSVAARTIVLAEKPPICTGDTRISSDSLEALLREVGNLSSVTHQLSSRFEEALSMPSDELDI